MKRMSGMGLLWAMAWGSAGCQDETYYHSEGTYAVGVQEVTGTGTVETAAHDYADYRRLLASEGYQGVSYFEVTKPGFDVTDTSRDGPEQVLRVRTSGDSETFSTWTSLEALDTDLIYGSSFPPGIAGAPSDELPSATTVTLGFPAILSSGGVSNNGVLEVDPNSDDALTVEWESVQGSNTLTAFARLEPVH